MKSYPTHYDKSLFSDDDIYYFKEGTSNRLFTKLGSHHTTIDGKKGVYFSVFAPNAKYISLIADFNSWNKGSHPLKLREDNSGIWEIFVENVEKGCAYKYYIESHFHGQQFEKSDPYAFFWEIPPHSSSKTWTLEYEWSDKTWMDIRSEHNGHNQPVSVYELHLGSWRRKPEENNRPLSYREIADELAPYLKEAGFTHVELLPVTEYPFDGSWGYQTIGYFAPTSRFGTPQDFMYFVDTLHQHGIGVLMDWVPSHFAVDLHGLANFDGTNVYEHSDPKQGFHPDWGSSIFNFERNEVKGFLISSALFWLEHYHIDGFRVDAVASMLYLDYSREEGEWIPNKYGGNENLGAIEFLRTLNSTVYENFPDVMMIAEESTAWPMVSKPVYLGGLGFGYKWNMGWMHDTLSFFKLDPIYRKFHQDQITFSIWYAFRENFMLSLSHDEVVHLKGSMINKMPGDYWQKFANLRLLYGYMFAHPGKKLLFMGGEFAQFSEWNYQTSLDWHLLDHSSHQGMLNWIKDLNKTYKSEPALYELDETINGFYWLDINDHENNILSFVRKGKEQKDTIVTICNFTPVPRYNYRIGVPYEGNWKELLNSDASIYYGSNLGNFGSVKADQIWMHEQEYSLNLTIPPFGILYLKYEG